MTRLALAVGFVCLASALTTAAEPTRREWTVGGLKREAFVYVPESAKTTATPVVFVFHGHGGTMKNAARTFAVHTHWPEAICVYPQGVLTPGKLTDPRARRPAGSTPPATTATAT